MNTIAIIIIAVLGSVLGSFFNVLIDRLPRKESIVKPGSHCTACGKAIPWYMNVPILSFIILRGKCSSCGARFHWHHIVVETITPALLVSLFLIHGLSGPLFYKYAIMACFMVPIFFIDAFHHIIPHVLSIPLIFIGLIFSFFAGTDLGFMVALITALTIFSLLYIIALLYAVIRKREGLGGGDIWLLTGLGTFFGAINMPFLILLAALMGILFFIIFIRNREMEFAFGNFIALAAVIWALAGDKILDLVL